MVSSAIRGRARTWLFLAVYYVLLPIGHAQAWLAKEFRNRGFEFGWPILLVWGPLRLIYVAGFRLCSTIRP